MSKIDALVSQRKPLRNKPGVKEGMTITKWTGKKRTRRTVQQTWSSYFGGTWLKKAMSGKEPKFPQEYLDLKAAGVPLDPAPAPPPTPPPAPPVVVPPVVVPPLPPVTTQVVIKTALEDGIEVTITGRSGTMRVNTKRTLAEILAFFLE